AERAATPAEGMVSCSLCGLNVPRSEAVQQSGRFFCCDDHRQRNA
ncbi:MAG: PP0621 family protein, partial [Burkholderiaceae bacterium]